MECQKKTHHSVETCTYFHKRGKHAEVTPPRYGAVGDIPH